MLIRTLPPTFLQLFCKINLNSEVICKSIIDPEVGLESMRKMSNRTDSEIIPIPIPIPILSVVLVSIKRQKQKLSELD